MPPSSVPTGHRSPRRKALDFERYVAARQRQVEAYLERCVPPTLGPEALNRAMRYTLFLGGKRIRPILTLAAGESVGARARLLMPVACAIELIHTYSLVHDDLPAMDDDQLRRGKPTNHMVFGEALAILAGDALLTEAFRIMGKAATRAAARQPLAVRVLVEIAAAAGPHGMVAGQAADIEAEKTAADLPTVELIHVRKTGALIRAAVRAGALLGGASSNQLRHLTLYSEFLGLAFQVVDDIMDAQSSTAVTGKITGQDRARNKATFPAVLGLPGAKQRAAELLAAALEELHGFDHRADPLRAIARFIVGRAHIA